ncbi:MAG: 23S rRNA (pseudouridine(1915)-N(3))-methyltransferase RlmH [Pseudomonadota bacterium]
MTIHILNISHRDPAWVDDATEVYNKRLQGHWQMQWHRFSPPELISSRNMSNGITTFGKTSENILKRVNNSPFILLSEEGKLINSLEFSQQLQSLLEQSQNIYFLIGAAEGIAQDIRQKASAVWSLGRLTYAHPLVKVILAEQIYRAWTIQIGHPYHNG